MLEVSGRSMPFNLAGIHQQVLSRLVMLNLLLDERMGRIQGLKAASTAKRKNDFKSMDELDRFWSRFGEQYWPPFNAAG